MIGRTNAGFSKSIAVIRVLYPAGTTCTCSNGVITYGSDESGDYLFGIPSPGNWTITGVDGHGAARTITLVIGRGDGKLVTLDTLIPPEHRTTYQEVEYLAFADNMNANVPLSVNVAPGSWDIEFEKIQLKPFTSFYTMLDGFSSSIYSSGTRLAIYNNYTEHITDRDIVPFVEHDVVFHISTADSDSGLTLKFDNETILSYETPTLGTSTEILIGIRDGSSLGSTLRGINLKNTGNLIAQYIPCKRRSDNMPGYFDLKDNSFHQAFAGYSSAVADVTNVVTCGPAIGT